MLPIETPAGNEEVCYEALHLLWLYYFIVKLHELPFL